MIVQDDRFDATASVTVCPLTTAVADAPLTRLVVDANADTGIETPSYVMVDKITTILRANVRERVGRLAEEDIGRLNRAIFVFLGLAD